MVPYRTKKPILGAKEVDEQDNMLDMIEKDRTTRTRMALDFRAAQMMFGPRVS